MIFLPLFFMYIFPLIFLGVPVLRTTPIFATILLIIGIILWTIQSYLILKYILGPKRMIKNHESVKYEGLPTKAEILNYNQTGQMNEFPVVELLVRFKNLAGNLMKMNIDIIDSKPVENRFEVGKEIDIKLNRNGFNPPFTLSVGEYETSNRTWSWLWLGFNIFYMFAFFILTYYLQNDGLGWRFLSPFTPWLWAPIIGITIIRFITPNFNQDIMQPSYRFISTTDDSEIGELIMYGQTTNGELIDYTQTQVFINENPEIFFNIRFTNNEGKDEYRGFSNIVRLSELHTIKKGETEIVYMPNNRKLTMFELKD